MALSFIVYTLLAFALCGLGWHAGLAQRNANAEAGHTGFWSWEVVLSIVIFAAVAGARYHTGFDHAMYLEQYQCYGNYGFFTRDFEWLFSWVTTAFSRCGIHFFFYFAFWAALQMGLLLYGVKDQKFLMPWLALVLVLNYYFLSMMNSMRQMTVACMFVAMVPLVRDGKWWRYIILCLLGSGIHQSALLLLAMPVFRRLNLLKPGRLKVLLPVFACCVVAGVYPIWLTWIFSGITRFFAMFNLDRYELVAQDILAGNFRATAWGISHVSTLLLTTAVFCMAPALGKFYKDNFLLKFSFTCYFVGQCLVNLFINTSAFFLRPFEYMTFMGLIVIAYVMHMLYAQRRWWLLAAFMALCLSYIYVEIVKTAFLPQLVNQVVLYHFFFQA